jgi:hypothetical protein
MKVRIEIPMPPAAIYSYGSPSQAAARRMQYVRHYLVDSRLKSIMDMHEIDYRILENFVFAVMSDEVFVEIKMACDLHVLNAKENNAVMFRTTYDD